MKHAPFILMALLGLFLTSSNAQENPGCVRGVAEPIIKKSIYPKSRFHIQPDNVTGIENVTLKNGDLLNIHNWGCEYYVLSFRIETSRFRHSTKDLKFWFITASKLIQSIIPALDAPMDLRKGTRYLTNYVVTNRKHKLRTLKLGEEIQYGGTDIRSFVTVDTIKKLKGSRTAIELSFATGPL